MSIKGNTSTVALKIQGVSIYICVINILEPTSDALKDDRGRGAVLVLVFSSCWATRTSRGCRKPAVMRKWFGRGMESIRTAAAQRDAQRRWETGSCSPRESWGRTGGSFTEYTGGSGTPTLFFFCLILTFNLGECQSHQIRSTVDSSFRVFM